MTDPLHTFPADLANDWMAVGGSLLLVLLMAAAFFYTLRTNKKLLLLFSGFIGLTALGVGVFSYVNTWKLPDIVLYRQGLSTPQGKASWGDIRKIEIKDLEQRSRFPIQRNGKFITVDMQRILLVEEFSGKAHIIPESNYPIEDIFEELRVLVEAYEKEKGVK